MQRYRYFYKLESGKMLPIRYLRKFIMNTFPWSSAAQWMAKEKLAERWEPIFKIGAWESLRASPELQCRIVREIA